MKPALLLVLALTSAVVSMSAQADRGRGARDAAPSAPQLKFHLVDDFFKWPENIWPSEAVGVALNSKGHIFLLNRGNVPLLEFGPDGSFIKAMGEGSTIFHAAHSVRFDAEDNMWLVDSGNNVVVKFTDKGRIVQALGRRLEPWVYLTHGIERAIPGPASFYQPTDTAVGPDGSTYVTDGYGNSRVAKFTKEGTLVKYWGDRGTRPGQFNTPHSVTTDRNRRVYVSDRANNRIQVFDENGKFLDMWPNIRQAYTIRVSADNFLWAFSGPLDKLLKYDLNGKLLYAWGTHGTAPGLFWAVHEFSADSDGNLYTAEVFGGRPQKFTPRPGADPSHIFRPQPLMPKTASN